MICLSYDSFMDLCIQTGDELLRVAQIDAEISGFVTLDQLEEFLHIIDGIEISFLDPNIQKMVDCVTKDPSLWPLLIPQSKRNEIISIAVRSIKAVLQDNSNREYLASWLEIRQFLDSLGRVRVAPKFWSQLRQKYPAMSGPAFSPSILTNTLLKTTYTTAGTTTGRLTVTAGPNFLVTPTESRKAIQSSTADSKIVIVDFSSMEPRVVLMAMGIPFDDRDIYQQLMQICDIDNRPAAKLATISALYGASKMRLADTVGSQRAAASLVENVRRFFGVEELEAKLELQFQTGVIRNFFGRPLHEAKQPRLRVNHFAQSTAAELSILLFADLCKKVPAATPLLVIHDALIAEVPIVDLEHFKNECQKISYQGYQFPTKMEVI